MYHSRTKKVASYGRRAQRVVAVSDDGHFSFDAFSSSTREQPNTEQTPHEFRKKEIDEDIFAPPVKYTVTKPSMSDRKAFRRPVTASSPQTATGKKFGSKNTPARGPLGLYQANIPNSPALPPKAPKARAGIGKGTPPPLRKVSNISPYVDVNIVVLDDTGRQLSEERRVTKANVHVNDIDGGVAKAAKRARRPTFVKSYATLASEEDDDGDEEYIPVSKASKGKRDVREPASGSNSRKSRQPVRKARKPRAPEKIPPLDDSDSDLPCRSQALKRAARTIIVTDSESESSAEIPSKAEQAHKTDAERLRGVHPGGAQITGHTANQSSRPLISEPSYPLHTSHEIGTSFPPTFRVPKKSYAGSQASRTKNLDATVFSNYDLPTQRHISVDSDTSQPRPRQLTPIKPSRSKAACLHPRPTRSSPSQLIVLSSDDDSLSIDEELELALQVADLQLAKSSRPSSKLSIDRLIANGPSASILALDRVSSGSQISSRKPYIPSYLRPLLSECGQLTPFDFATFIETFAVDPIIGFSDHTGFAANFSNNNAFHAFQKVGEASYSEVFGIGNVVLKVIPLLDEENDASTTWTAGWDSPPVSEAKDVLKEVFVTRAMGDICKGFIKLLKAHVVQGQYPRSLLALWDKYDNIKGSESVRPDHFSSMQSYAIIILPNGGPDLENFSFGPSNLNGGTGWRQACSIFWQVARSLGRAEELVHFEHRDLHWGQILVRNTIKSSRPLATGSHGTVALDDPSHGVQSTIIDLGLARIDQGQGDSFWTLFAEEIFEGKGDYQYDVYRMMRKHNKDEWRSFRPLTNVMWLHYLADKLINHKSIRAPTRSAGRNGLKGMHVGVNPAIAEADKRAYDCLVEVERSLGISIASVARSAGVKAKHRSKVAKDASTAAGVGEALTELKSAIDVLHLGKEMSWIL